MKGLIQEPEIIKGRSNILVRTTLALLFSLITSSTALRNSAALSIISIVG